jgi:hypothetical protein
MGGNHSWGHRRHGSGGEAVGDGKAGRGGRKRGHGGRGAGGGARRLRGAVAGLLTWAAEEAGFLDHGEREDVIGQEGRELQRRLLQATFALDSAREERIPQVASAAGIRHGTVEAGTAGAWRASSGPCGSRGWPTATGVSRTCTLPTPGRSCPMTRTRWACAP